MSSGKPAAPLFQSRSLRLCYWNAEARIVDAERVALEQHLARLGEVKVQAVKALESPEVRGADLLIVAAPMVPADKFPEWLAGFRRRIQATGHGWSPALILADVSFDVLSEIWPDVTRENWYFDILAPAHMASLPIRVANLLRIHDHLHELKRYSQAIDDVNSKVKALESQMRQLGASRGGEP
jgi:hypothetical protein